MNDKLVNESLIKFWDSAIVLSLEDKEQLRASKDLDYKQLVPSEELFVAVSKLGACKSVLDYGCGNAWGAIVANKSGAKNVTAVDIGSNIIDTAKFYAELFNANINAFSIDPNWLISVKSNSYDGIICSNVLDVVPLGTCKEIIENIARILVNKGTLIIGLNFYMPKEMAIERGMPLVDDKYLFVNDVLRLMSLNDDEWKELFSPYFDIEKLEYFSWPGEKQETRRLFTLKKK